MISSAKLKIITHDLEPEMHNPFSLWTGPSSPPFNQPQIIPHHSLASSPSTSSEFEFEFDSIASIEIKDDPPVSPKLISSYWGGAGTATVSSFDSLPPPDMKQKIAPLSHPITSPKQPSALPSPSVRQLMAEDDEQDDDFSLDFYSAPQTPTPRKSAPADLEQWPLYQDDEPSLSIVTSVGQRKSNSAALDKQGAHDDSVAPPAATQKSQLSKAESNSHFALWTSSFAWEKSEEEKVKKQGSKSGMKWAFKDLLRRTVPSSKAEAHYITKTMGASSSRKYLLSSSKSNPNIVSTLASTSLSTPGRSPTHSSATCARSSPRHPSTPKHSTAQTLNRTPTPSPPRSPLSPHAIHYQQNKAQSLELTRKTFLPYRQSLLGCLGGPGAFPPEQQAW